MFDKFALDVTEKLNKQMQEGFEKQADKINAVARKTSELDQKLIEMSASVSASSTVAQQALQAVTDLKKNINSNAPSEASTEVPMSTRLSGFASSFRAQAPRPAPAPVPRYPDCEKSPDNDGLTILVGGFPRDTERQRMQEFLTEKLSTTEGITDIEAKYRLGSTALMRFRTSNLMWAFMRSRPSITFEEKSLFFTIPKSPTERARDKKLVLMRTALENLLPADKKATIQWSEKVVQVDNKTVARFCIESMEMQMSASQLRAASITASKSMIMEKFKTLLESSAPLPSDIKDWS